MAQRSFYYARKSTWEDQLKKLRNIILLEEDFKTLHNIIFNTRLIPRLEVDHLIPQEIVGSRTSQSAIQLTMRKI